MGLKEALLQDNNTFGSGPHLQDDVAKAISTMKWIAKKHNRSSSLRKNVLSKKCLL